MSGGRILLTGGTGKTGRRIAQRLVAGNRGVRIASRAPAQPSLEQAVESISFDWAEPRTYESALRGVDRVYLVAPALVLDAASLMNPFIERAIQLGVRRFVLLSSTALADGGPVMGRVESFLRQHAPEWSVLKPSWFMQNFTEGHHAASIRATGTMTSAAGEGRVRFVDADDIADVAVRCLVDAAQVNGVLNLCGPDALTYDEVAAIISRVCSRPLQHARVTTAQLSQAFIGAGVPTDYATFLAELDHWLSRGGENSLISDVQRVLGRRPRSFAEFADMHKHSWI